MMKLKKLLQRFTKNPTPSRPTWRDDWDNWSKEPWAGAENLCEGLSPETIAHLAAGEAPGECTAHGGCILCRLEALEDQLRKPDE